ncbi:hypothetical protein [Micromonospora chersina]|uniref:hypothetical protein n=1 Tax=Micromonospora chersina TaxID=47854 RepID=UPI003F4D207F
MLAGLEMPPAVEAEQVITAVLADLRSSDHRGVVVDSLSGAGESTLVVRAAVELAAAGEPMIVIAQTNEQVDDLIDRLAGKPPVRVLQWGRLPLPSTRRMARRSPPDLMAIGAAHRDWVAAIRAQFGMAGTGITADTANGLQGRVYDLAIMHPPSGRRECDCVPAGVGATLRADVRHRHACIVVARAAIAELLDAHRSAEPVHFNVPVKFSDGWEANQSVMARLHGHRMRT